MEIRIAYHPNSDTLMSRISQLLADNGIEYATSTEGVLEIAPVEEAEGVVSGDNYLGSSFVETDAMPGY